MSEPSVSRETVLAAMKAVEEETIRRCMKVARQYGDNRNRSAAAGDDKQKAKVSAAYMIASDIERLPRLND